MLRAELSQGPRCGYERSILGTRRPPVSINLVSAKRDSSEIDLPFPVKQNRKEARLTITKHPCAAKALEAGA